MQRSDLQERLTRTDRELERGMQTLDMYMDMLTNGERLYAQANDLIRRQLLEAFFPGFRIDSHDEIEVHAESHPAVQALTSLETQTQVEWVLSNEKSPHLSIGARLVTALESLFPFSKPKGSNKGSLVDAVAAYSNLLYPHKNARALRKLLADAETSTRKKESSEPSPARRLCQRLGSEVVDQILADYKSGIPTTELADTYSISKHGVLTLLTEAGVAVRRQPLTDEQVSSAAMLYEAGKSLAAVSRELGVAQESLRRALVNSGIPMRIRGGSKSKNFLVTQP